jgi:hypothetical protein
LWVRVEPRDTHGLVAAHALIDAALFAHPELRRALVTVRWTTALRTEAAVCAHLAWAARAGGRVSTWAPLCAPGAPVNPQAAAFATPGDCAACVFYRARACQGFGDEDVPFARLTDAAPALSDAAPALADPSSARFDGQTPAAYWAPPRRAIAALGAATRAAGGTLWDLGGGSGFVAGLLARDEGLRVTVFDQGDVWSGPPGVERVVGDLRARITGRTPPAAVLVSWPPTGDAFRDVVRALRPRVLAYAYDAEGACGRRRTHAGLVTDGLDAQWFRGDADDFAPLPWLVRRFACAVRASRDAPGIGHGGRFELRTADTFAPPGDAVTPYPWEAC